MSPRPLRRCCLLFLLCGVTAFANDLTIVRVFTGWRDASSFKRISEYFNGHENTGGEAIIRTHPEERSGYYFLLRTNCPGAIPAAKINLQIILPATIGTSNEVKKYSFPFDFPAGSHVLNLGLTGDDWAGSKINPVAWKLEIVAADGRVLGTEKSYLWEMPASP